MLSQYYYRTCFNLNLIFHQTLIKLLKRVEYCNFHISLEIILYYKLYPLQQRDWYPRIRVSPPKSQFQQSELFYFNTAVVFFTHSYIIFSMIFTYNLLKVEPRLNPSLCDSITAHLQLYSAAVESEAKTHHLLSHRS